MSGKIYLKTLLHPNAFHERNLLLKKVILLFLAVLLPLMTVSLIYLNHNNLKQRQQTLDAIQSNNDSYIARLDENLQQIYTANLH
ncbi:MAG: two-component sensor histidine kinase, partial [Faecalimonas umbilicata]